MEVGPWAKRTQIQQRCLAVWVWKGKRVLRRVLGRGSEKGGFQKVLRTPCWRVRPLGVCPILYLDAASCESVGLP